MTRSRISCCIIFVTLAISVSSASGNKSDAAEIIAKVAETYRNAQSYEFDVLEVLETTARGSETKKETRVHVAAVKPDKMQMEITGSMMGLDSLMISNGSTTWEYLPNHKQYVKRIGTPTTITSKGIDSKKTALNKELYFRVWAAALGVSMPDYSGIEQTMLNPRLLREEPIEVSGTNIDCYVIEGDDTQPQFDLSPKTFWIDKARYLVVREMYTLSLRGQGVTKHTTVFKVATVNELLPDSMFLFTPPEGATLVDDFNSNDGSLKKRKN
jgi:outer membrane lipoprotein-sorting protein